MTRTYKENPVCIGICAPLAAYFLFQVSLGLRTCHAHGVLHRDLKPENVVLCPPRVSPVQATADFADIPACHAASSRVVAKLIDFGTAKDLTGGAANGPEFVGTPEYIPPEVIGGGAATHAMDLWALGVLLFQCLTGFHPFGTGSPYMTMQRVRCGRLPLPLYLPPTAQDLLEKLLVPDPQARLQAWGASGGGSAAMDAVLQHPFWDANPRRARLACALQTLASKLFPESSPNEAVSDTLLGAPSGDVGGKAAVGVGAGASPPTPPLPPPRAAPTTWPAPPASNTTWDDVQAVVQALLGDEILLSIVQSMHAGTPLAPPPPPAEDKAPPPDPDTTLEGSADSLSTAVAAVGLERWLHWWAHRAALQERPRAQRQWVRHQLALRGELWSLPVLGLFAPTSVCSEPGSDLLLRVQRCLAWARIQRGGLHPKRFRLSTPPSGAASQHDAFTSAFTLVMVRCTVDGMAVAASSALAAVDKAATSRLRAVAFVLVRDTSAEGTTEHAAFSDRRVLQVLSGLPLNVQVAVVDGRPADVMLDGDEERTHNTEWILHGTRVCFWSASSMQRPLEYAWWSDALDSSKYTSRHHVVVDVEGCFGGEVPMHKRAFLSAKRLLHHTSNTRAVLSCVQEGTVGTAGTLRCLLAGAASACQKADTPAEEPTPAGPGAPHIISPHGALSWETLDADDAEHNEAAAGGEWTQLLPEASGGAAAAAGSDSEDEHAVSKHVPIHAIATESITLLHFSQDAVAVSQV